MDARHAQGLWYTKPTSLKCTDFQIEMTNFKDDIKRLIFFSRPEETRNKVGDHNNPCIKIGLSDSRWAKTDAWKLQNIKTSEYRWKALLSCCTKYSYNITNLCNQKTDNPDRRVRIIYSTEICRNKSFTKQKKVHSRNALQYTCSKSAVAV